jgi:hypothetical protein
MASQSVLNAQPNAATLRVDLTDWLYGRFLETLPPVSQPAPTGPARYWGAH